MQHGIYTDKMHTNISSFCIIDFYVMICCSKLIRLIVINHIPCEAVHLPLAASG